LSFLLGLVGSLKNTLSRTTQHVKEKKLGVSHGKEFLDQIEVFHATKGETPVFLAFVIITTRFFVTWAGKNPPFVHI